ncbi:hypothetical protein [Streptomyces smaragdinus]|nr:hypothetical protein [Streptomyces smaragdinus]
MRTVLYIAFAAVTLWLLWEVLMQYKARLRWRVVALGGFLLVAGGLFVLGSRLVIALGAVLFAWGQVKVTLSYRSGFSDGWSLGPHDDEDDEDDRPRPPRRREAAYDDYDEPPAAAPLPKRSPPFEPAEPAPAGQFSAFGDGPQPAAPAAPGGYDGYNGGYDTGGYATTSAGYDTGSYQTTGGYPGQDQSQGGQQSYAQNDSYAGYSDPYSGTQYATPSYYDGGNGSYDTGSYQTTGGYDPQAYGGDQGTGGYPAQGGYDSGQYPAQQPGGYAPDGTWVPQQREGEDYDPGQYPSQQGYPGYDGQYRY